jgi:hypothetical protein
MHPERREIVVRGIGTAGVIEAVNFARAEDLIGAVCGQ